MNAFVQIEDLSKRYKSRRGDVWAAIGVNLAIGRGETLALVGESGSGKSTIAQCLIGLAKPDRGRIAVDGKDLATLDRRSTQALRRRIGVVFQNPYSSLDPRMTVRSLVGEGVCQLHPLRGAALTEVVVAHLEEVGLGTQYLDRFPHALSGGQRQRVAIARALALEPELIVLDEPTAALDVSVQAQILNLLNDLKRARRLSYLFISHNLAAVRFLADSIAVIYLGRIIEQGAAARVLANPSHPYTRLLLDSIPRMNPEWVFQAPAVAKESLCADTYTDRCSFAPRCDRADAPCQRAAPPLTPAVHAPASLVACFHPLITVE